MLLQRCSLVRNQVHLYHTVHVIARYPWLIYSLHTCTFKCPSYLPCQFYTNFTVNLTNDAYNCSGRQHRWLQHHIQKMKLVSSPKSAFTCCVSLKSAVNWLRSATTSAWINYAKNCNINEDWLLITAFYIHFEASMLNSSSLKLPFLLIRQQDVYFLFLLRVYMPVQIIKMLVLI